MHSCLTTTALATLLLSSIASVRAATVAAATCSSVPSTPVRCSVNGFEVGAACTSTTDGQKLVLTVEPSDTCTSSRQCTAGVCGTQGPSGSTNRCYPVAPLSCSPGAATVPVNTTGGQSGAALWGTSSTPSTPSATPTQTNGLGSATSSATRSPTTTPSSSSSSSSSTSTTAKGYFRYACTWDRRTDVCTLLDTPMTSVQCDQGNYGGKYHTCLCDSAARSAKSQCTSFCNDGRLSPSLVLLSTAYDNYCRTPSTPEEIAECKRQLAGLTVPYVGSLCGGGVGK